MDEMILLLKQSIGSPALLSGQFQLSQEIRLSGTPGGELSGKTLSGTGTPSQAFLSGTHPLPPATTPSAAFSGSFAQPVAAPSPSVPPPAPQAGWLPKLAVIGALGIAGGFLALRFSERTGAVGGPQDAAPAAAPSGAAAPQGGAEAAAGTEAQAAEETQHHVLVNISSVPAGATVTVDGKPYGQTPADIEWWGELAEPGREIQIVLQKDGYEKVTLVRSIMGERLAVEATLPRIAPPPTRRRPSTGSSASGTTETPRVRGPVVVPDDFKNDPY
jgi:hypothetical protein